MASRIIMPRDRTLDFTLAELFEEMPEMADAWKFIRESHDPENEDHKMLLVLAIHNFARLHGLSSTGDLTEYLESFASNVTDAKVSVTYKKDGTPQVHIIPDKLN